MRQKKKGRGKKEDWASYEKIAVKRASQITPSAGNSRNCIYIYKNVQSKESFGQSLPEFRDESQSSPTFCLSKKKKKKNALQVVVLLIHVYCMGYVWIFVPLLDFLRPYYPTTTTTTQCDNYFTSSFPITFILVLYDPSLVNFSFSISSSFL